MKFNFQQAFTLVFWFSQNNGLFIVVPPLMTHQDTKLHGPTLTGASFASTSED
jgi:hypothetical protein